MFLVDSSFQLQLAFIKQEEVFTYRNNGIEKSSDIIVQKALNLLSEANACFYDIECIAVIVGPGLFTGVRTGVLFANMLSYVLNKPIIAIDTFEVLSFEGISLHRDIDLVLSMINIGKKGAVCSLLDKNLDCKGKAAYISEMEIDEYIYNISKEYEDKKLMLVGNQQHILNIAKNSKGDEKGNMIMNPAIQNPNLSYLIKLASIRYRDNMQSKKAYPFYVGDPSIQINKI